VPKSAVSSLITHLTDCYRRPSASLPTWPQKPAQKCFAFSRSHFRSTAVICCFRQPRCRAPFAGRPMNSSAGTNCRRASMRGRGREASPRTLPVLIKQPSNRERGRYGLYPSSRQAQSVQLHYCSFRSY